MIEKKSKPKTNLVPEILKLEGQIKELEDKLKNLINEYMGFLQKNSYIPGFILAELNQNPEKIIDALADRFLTLFRPPDFR